MIKEQIIALIKAKQAHVGVVGLGYVGLPLLAEFAGSGFQATGFEVDENKAAQINAGSSYIGDVDSSVVKDLVESKRLSATRARLRWFFKKRRAICSFSGWFGSQVAP